MYCRLCGSEINDKAVICVKCGGKPFIGKAYCSRCGCKTNDDMELCPSCGARLRPKPIKYKRKAKTAKRVALVGFALTVLIFILLFIRSKPESIPDSPYMLYSSGTIPSEYHWVRTPVSEEVQSYWAESRRLGVLLVISFITAVISSIVTGMFTLIMTNL